MHHLDLIRSSFWKFSLNIFVPFGDYKMALVELKISKLFKKKEELRFLKQWILSLLSCQYLKNLCQFSISHCNLVTHSVLKLPKFWCQSVSFSCPTIVIWLSSMEKSQYSICRMFALFVITTEFLVSFKKQYSKTDRFFSFSLF